jgi:hypothetical protein
MALKIASVRCLCLATAVMAVCMSTDIASAARVSVIDRELLIAEADDEHNVIDVFAVDLVYRVYDDSGPIDAGPGCIPLQLKLVECLSPVDRIRANGGTGGDLIGLVGLGIPVEAVGGAGDDLIETGDAASFATGGDGVDSLVGGDGIDRLDGAAGDDLLIGGDEADTLLGAEGDDIINGQSGGDTAIGSDGRDLVRGGAGDDVLEGGGSDDVLIGGEGRDEVGTGSGNDVVFGADGSADTIDCRSGDRVRGERQEIPEGCARLPAGATQPNRWPPADDARAAIPPPDPTIRARLRIRGAATRYTIRAKASESFALRLQVCTYNRAKVRIKRFNKTVQTRHKRSYYTPSPKRRAHHIRAKREIDGCE